MANQCRKRVNVEQKERQGTAIVLGKGCTEKPKTLVVCEHQRVTFWRHKAPDEYRGLLVAWHLGYAFPGSKSKL
ncbi:hypothetical protein VFPPC_16675 [Pochonia chlamydosporia 170]|uniref:Uncharacterized protein n=1 Tax=Pochonia chlamydosporia 170 TaxID=1380566 RepID=A0A179F6D3_METCM|nr:hypothetical protein VFPPC_16675 [Pochonia chlamydosporia 170]OAQ60910.1 hypothetical protein VFPPC_16675 [Pochonia chlamydosporia 170]